MTTPTAAVAAVAAASPRAASSRLMGNGKVRQMFDERRRGAGIDRSNPLKPIGEQQQHHLVKGVSAISLKEKSISSDSNNNSNINGNNNNKISSNNRVQHPVAGRLKPVVVRKTPPNAREKEREKEREREREKEREREQEQGSQSSARSRTLRTTTNTTTTTKTTVNPRLAGGVARAAVPERSSQETPRKTRTVSRGNQSRCAPALKLTMYETYDIYALNSN